MKKTKILIAILLTLTLTFSGCANFELQQISVVSWNYSGDDSKDFVLGQFMSGIMPSFCDYMGRRDGFVPVEHENNWHGLALTELIFKVKNKTDFEKQILKNQFYVTTVFHSKENDIYKRERTVFVFYKDYNYYYVSRYSNGKYSTKYNTYTLKNDWSRFFLADGEELAFPFTETFRLTSGYFEDVAHPNYIEDPVETIFDWDYWKAHYSKLENIYCDIDDQNKYIDLSACIKYDEFYFKPPSVERLVRLIFFVKDGKNYINFISLQPA